MSSSPDMPWSSAHSMRGATVRAGRSGVAPRDPGGWAGESSRGGASRGPADGRRQVALLDAAAAGAGDEAAVAAGDSWAGLMARAAGHLARGVLGLAGHGYGLRVAIVVGKGDNGGDGWAAARPLRERGAVCWVLAPHGVEVEVSESTGANRAAWLAGGGRTSAGLDDLDAALDWADVAVDCLLGTGISGAPRGEAGDACRALTVAHERGVPVVACDVPSGVSSDDGSAPEGSVTADLTVTFGGIKRGLLLHPGAAHAGRVVVGDLGARYAAPDVAWSALTADGAAPSRLAAATDKRARGTALVVAGSRDTPGAAALCGRAALATGAGLVTVAVPGGGAPAIVATEPALMTRPLAAGDDGVIAATAADDVAELAGDLDVVVAGPGLGHGPGTAAVVAALRGSASRLVLDADGLNVHRDDPDALSDHAGTLVLTPHERELARIGGGSDGTDAWSRRAERVPELAARYDATIVAKGPGTLVAAPDGRVWVTPLSSPALGTGGTGDVLAGMIGAAIATADDVPLAVARAVWWHAFAAEHALTQTTADGGLCQAAASPGGGSAWRVTQTTADGGFRRAGAPHGERAPEGATQTTADGGFRRAGPTREGFGAATRLLEEVPSALAGLDALAAVRPGWPLDLDTASAARWGWR